MTLITQYFPVYRIKKFLTTKKLYWAQYLLSALFGVITPFCSCSAIPLFIGFLNAGIPLGVTLTFLITSPMVNEVAIALLAGTLWMKVVLIYIFVGIGLAMVSGYLLGKMNLDSSIAPFLMDEMTITYKQHTFRERLSLSVKKSFTLIEKIFPYVLLGVAVGAGIHGLIPDGYFTTFLQGSAWYTLPLAVIAGVPMYTNAAGVVPVVQALIAKWVPLATALTFMMAVIGLSLPEFLILKKVMKAKLLFLFFGVVALCMMIAGAIFTLIF